MSTPSNLYAEKVFSEHPIVLWALDDEFSIDTEPDVSPLTFTPFTDLDFSGIKTYAYGLENNYGYFIRDDTSLYAKNNNIPMVYGAANVTSIYPISSTDPLPSLVLPANGFMHNSGRYKTLTAEMWLRITANTNAATGIYTKIFGPTSSDDGLYVYDSFLMLKIGNNIKSHYVGEWERPMLVQISTAPSSANLIINGELAFTMPYEYSFEYADDSSASWLGFYARSTYVRLVEIDCVAIYPYEVTPTIAKRRFLYGQATDYPENVNVAYNGISAFVDYSFANYSTNYSYPKNAKWSNGIQSNTLASGDFLTSPNYQLPTFYYNESGKIYSSVIGWDQLQASKQSSSYPERNLMKFKDSTGHGYFKFNSLKILENGLGAISIHLVTGSDVTTKQSIFKIVNKISGDYLEAIIEDSLLYYVSYINKQTYDSTTFGNVQFGGPGEVPIVIGLEIAEAKNFAGLHLSTFFDDLENLSMYIAGTESTTATFKGWYEYINLFAADSQNAFSSYDDGSIYESYPDLAEYSLRLNKIIDGLYVDIATRSYWQDYVPLTYLSKPLTIDGVKSYAIDFIQYNANITIPTSTYDQYVQSGQVRSWVSLQKISSPVTNKQYSFNSSSGLLSSGVVTISQENRLYSVADNSIITIDDSFNIDEYALYLHIWLYNPGVLKNPITLKNLELSSKTFEGDTAIIGTRFGVNLESFKGNALNYFKIYKSSSPHLYLTGKSGIELTGGTEDSGISLKLNYFDAPSYYLSGIQMALKYTKTEFPNGSTLLFSITSNNNHFKVYMNNSMSNPYSTLTMKVVNPDNSESIYTDVDFFLNGHIVENPTINIKEWNMFGIRFKGLILFNETSQASLKLVGPMLFNNISTYRLGEIESRQKFIYNVWDNLTTSTWGDIDAGTWQDQLYSSINIVTGVDLSEIYRIYLGTNKINMVNDEYSQFDESLTKLNGYKYIVYTDAKWQSIVTKPL